MNIVYIVSIEDIWRTPTVRTQVIELLKILPIHYKGNIHLVSFYSVLNYLRFRKQLKDLYLELQKHQVHFHVIPVVFLGRLFVMTWPVLLFLYLPQVFIGSLWLKLKFKNKDILYHCRGYPASIIGFLMNILFKKPFIFDMRGLYIEEAVLVHKRFTRSSLSSKIWQFLEKKLVNRASTTVAVSEPFKKIVSKKYPKSHIEMIPNCSRVPHFQQLAIWNEKYRKKLGLNNEIVVIYAGGQGPIHKPEDIIDAYKKIIESSPETKWFFLYLIAGDVKLIEISLKKYSLKRWKVISVDQHDVLKYLSIGHFGIMTTRDSSTGKLWMPIKFAEYLSAGLTIICSDNLGQITQIVKEHEIGIIYDQLANKELKEKLSYFIKHRENIKKKSWQLAKNHFSIEENIKKYSKIYNKISTKKQYNVY